MYKRQARTDIVAVSAGDYHTVGLKSDGTVVAVGGNHYGQCDVADWTDIVAVSAGSVSYTHLDVYKRQGRISWLSALETNIQWA